MTGIPEMASLIRSLHSADPSERQRAAREIFERSRELARPAIEEWFRDPEIFPNAGFDPADTKSWPPGIAVGLAVERETFERIRAANGSPRLANVPPEHDAEEFGLDFPEGVRLGILAARQPDGNGAIARYLRKFGEGIQQIEIPVRDIGRATQILRTRFGLAPAYPTARAGADGTRVNFFLAPAKGRKVLIELVEPPQGSAPPRQA
ncbi:MAG: hypothetical protein WA175_11505 [Candidatus Acidiferrales bacterium]